MIVTFCGHSQYTKTKEDEEKVILLLSELIGNQHAELYLGGYGSFDEFARQCGMKYQSSHPNTKLIFITPYITHSYQSKHLAYKKELYDDIIYPELEKAPPKFAISYRNKWMVDKSDYIIAYIDHSWGGAYQTYKYAKRKSKRIFNITDKEIQ